MEIKVKAVESPDSKSVQEVEKELLEKHEESLNDEAGEANMEGVEQSTESATTTEEQDSVQPEGEAQTESSELSEEDVSFIYWKKDMAERLTHSMSWFLSESLQRNYLRT